MLDSWTHRCELLIRTVLSGISHFSAFAEIGSALRFDSEVKFDKGFWRALNGLWVCLDEYVLCYVRKRIQIVTAV